MDIPKKNILLDIGGVLLNLHFNRAAEKLKSFTDSRRNFTSLRIPICMALEKR